MEAHDPSPHSFGQDIELAAHLLIKVIDGLDPPRRLESNMTVHSVADSLGSLAAETSSAYQVRYANDRAEITEDEIYENVISSLQSYGISVGFFRKRKIRRILSL